LLDTYESERAPHVRKYIEQAVRLGGLIQIRDPKEAERRDQRFREQPELLKSIKPSLGPGLQREASPRVGELAPQSRLRDGRLLDDAVGTVFALITTRAFAEQLSPSERELCRRSNIIIMADEGLDYLGALGASAAIIRPDRYLLGTADNGQDLRRLIAPLPAEPQVAEPA
jgi:3-(3-hydroxy-phenyl)propionate hydroxylase